MKTNKKHIINPEKQLGVQKKQYRNGYNLYTYTHKEGYTYKFITASVCVFYTKVIYTLFDINPTYQYLRKAQKYDFWNL